AATAAQERAHAAEQHAAEALAHETEASIASLRTALEHAHEQVNRAGAQGMQAIQASVRAELPALAEAIAADGKALQDVAHRAWAQLDSRGQSASTEVNERVSQGRSQTESAIGSAAEQINRVIREEVGA